MSIIETKEVSFAYSKNTEVLKNVSLSFNEGEFIALVGKNGAGKTTFAKLLNGILRPSKGSIKIQGKNTADLKLTQIAKIVGYCYQNPDHQIFEDNIIKEISFGPKNVGIPQERILEKVEEVLDLFQLRDYLDIFPFQMSKGLRQKVAVASVLAMEPQVMIIDEPTTGMDRKESISIMKLIDRLNKAGHTIIIITHDIKILKEYPNRVVAFQDGRVVYDGAPNQLLLNQQVLINSHLRPLQATRLSKLINCKKMIEEVLDAETLVSNIEKLIINGCREETLCQSE